MQSESTDPGSSLSTPVAHSTATHKHKSPMHRFMNGLKRLNSYSSEKSDSSSSGDDENHNPSSGGQDGSDEFVERHRVQEIRFNYESWFLHLSSFPDFPTKTIRFTGSKEVFLDPRQMSPQIRCTLSPSRFTTQRYRRNAPARLHPLAPPGCHGHLFPRPGNRHERGSHRPRCRQSRPIRSRESVHHLPLR